MIKKILISSIGIFLLSSCALMNRDEIQKRDEQQKQISTIQRSRAEQDLRYNDMLTEQRALSGRLDALEHNQDVAAQSGRQENDNLKKMIDALGEKMKILQDHLSTVETRLTAAIQAASGTLTPQQAPVSPQAPSARGNGVVAASENAQAGPLAEAEANFQSKEYKKAIVGYQGYVDKYPKGKLVPEATYKIGVSFAELGYKKDAKEFLKDVVDNYPSSSWAKKAKYRLSHIK